MVDLYEKEHLSSWIKIDRAKLRQGDNFGGKVWERLFAITGTIAYPRLCFCFRRFVYLDGTLAIKSMLQHLDDYFK